MLVETKTAKYHVGEKWRFRSRPGEESATLTILKVESDEKRGVTIVHVTVEGVRIKAQQRRTAFDSGKGGIFTITVGEGIAFLEKAME